MSNWIMLQTYLSRLWDISGDTQDGMGDTLPRAVKEALVQLDSVVAAEIASLDGRNAVRRTDGVEVPANGGCVDQLVDLDNTG